VLKKSKHDFGAFSDRVSGLRFSPVRGSIRLLNGPGETRRGVLDRY
jgi:hypothetical protein